MSQEIIVFDRVQQKTIKEVIYGRFFVELLYGKSLISFFFRLILLPVLTCGPLFSRLYGLFQSSRLSRYKIAPFIKKFHINTQEFLHPVHSFTSFNEFFIRKLKPAARPITPGNHIAILPADGRYLVYPNAEQADGFVVKGKKFSLQELLGSTTSAAPYQKGAVIIARLCPTDYHRFHFPCDCLPSEAIPILGPLHSVNPMAITRNPSLLSQNKRSVTLLQTRAFGQIAFIEIGAICVGAIHQTYQPFQPYHKGEEKGFFSFGGSSLIALFEEDTLELEKDLILHSSQHREILGLLGQPLGCAKNRS